MMTARTTVAIFDLDGTLVDTPRAIVAAFTATFDAIGAPAADPAAVRRTIGLPLEIAFGALLAVPPDDPQVSRAVQRYQLVFREQVLPRAGELLFPMVEEGLATLRRGGLDLAVATSKWYASADALLRAAGLRAYFRVVLGADQVSRPKPDPEMARTILTRLGATAGQAVVVGDTVHDLEMARSAGIRSIAVTYGVHGEDELREAGPTWIATSFEEVLRHLDAER